MNKNGLKYQVHDVAVWSYEKYVYNITKKKKY